MTLAVLAISGVDTIGRDKTSKPPKRRKWSSALRGAIPFSRSTAQALHARPALSKLLCEFGAGETLVVARLDRLARSVSHLLQVIEDSRP